MHNLLNYLFASQCIFCRYPFTDFCLGCLSETLFIEKPVCIECKNFSINGITHSSCFKGSSPTVLYSIFIYEGKVAACIRRSKYFRKEFASMKELIRYGVSFLNCNDLLLDGFEIVTVPLSKKRFKIRGFNQALFISDLLGRKLNLPLLKSYVIRIKHTEAQYTQDKFERSKNKAFKVVKEVKGKKILIVDDIFTTGSTMLELSKTLYNAGAKEVRCFSLSRVL